jgi:hypothetical protein
MKLTRQLALVFLPLLTAPALAGDFDGSKPLICAPVSAMECVRGDDCATGLPEDVGAPAFMRLDFSKKTVAGPKRTSDILLMEKTDNQLLMQGREEGFGWTIVLESQSGEMNVTLANADGAFVLFGSCTPL